MCRPSRLPTLVTPAALRRFKLQRTTVTPQFQEPTMPSTSPRLRTLLSATILAAMTLTAHAAPPAARVQGKALPAAPADTASVIAMSKDNTRLEVTVNSNGYVSPAYLYDAAGDYLNNLTFSSYVMFDFVLPEATDFQKVGERTVKSRFTASGLDVQLKQTIEAGPLTDSYLMTQRFELSNPGSEAVTVLVTRYQDSDLISDVYWNDAGYMPAKGRWTYLLSELSPNAAVTTNYVGVALAGGTEQRRVVRPCCGAYEIPQAENRAVDGDDDGDGSSDWGNDRAMTQQRRVTVPAGGQVTVTAETLFGHTAIASRAALPTK